MNHLIHRARRFERAPRPVQDTSLLAHLPIGAFLMDPAGRVVFVNDAWIGVTGYSQSETIGRAFLSFLKASDRKSAETTLSRIRGKEDGIANLRACLKRKNGSPMEAELTVQELLNDDSSLRGYAGIVAKVHHSEQESAKGHSSEVSNDQLLGTATSVTVRLLTHGDPELNIREALKMLGEGIGVDRTYIYQKHPHAETGDTLISRRFEWTRSDHTSQADNPLLQNLPIRAVPGWRKALRAGHALSGLVKGMPAHERILLEEQGIKSALLMPLLIEGDWWGFIGFDDCHSERAWSQREQTVLMSVAAAFAGAVQQLVANRELMKVREQAEAADQTRMAFLSNMSHEFRSPLAVVLGYSDLLKTLIDTGDDLPKETVSGALHAIRRSAKRLQALVHDVLDMSRLEEGAIDFFSVEMDVNAILSNIVEEYGSDAEAKGVRIVLEKWPEPAMIVGDRVRIEEVFANLVENAVKFTNEGLITVRSQLVRLRKTCSVVVEVEDTGIGISETYLPHIFKPFTQESNGSTRAFEGAGLGLALSYRLIELMGGQLHVRSRKGQGSTFMVKLPCAPDQNESASDLLSAELLVTADHHMRLLPNVVLIGNDKPIFHLWQHLLHDNCHLMRVGQIEEAVIISRRQEISLFMVDVESAGGLKAASRLSSLLKKKVESAPRIAVLPEHRPEWNEMSSFDDTIWKSAPVNSFFEIMLKWLPREESAGYPAALDR